MRKGHIELSSTCRVKAWQPSLKNPPLPHQPQTAPSKGEVKVSACFENMNNTEVETKLKRCPALQKIPPSFGFPALLLPWLICLHPRSGRQCFPLRSCCSLSFTTCSFPQNTSIFCVLVPVFLTSSPLSVITPGCP